MSRVALLNRVKQVEASRLINASILLIRGGLSYDVFPAQATIVNSSGVISTHRRLDQESTPAFISRLQSQFNPTCISLGGLPRLPGTAVTGF